MLGIYDAQGIRFQYPANWEIDVSDDGPRTSVAIQSPNGPAFLLVTIDETCPRPTDLLAEALGALREEYSELDADPASETIDGQNAIGHDVEFFSLDMTNNCILRSFATPKRTVFVLAQWSDLESDTAPDVLAAVRRSIESTDS